MRITIDTKEDSHDDIKRVLDILHHIVKGKENVVETVSASEDATAFTSMFAAPVQPEQTPTEPQQESAPDFSAFLNLASSQEEEKKDEEPKVEFF